MNDNRLNELKKVKYIGYENIESIIERRAWIRYGDIKEDKNGNLIELPCCTGSDYSGTTIELSNYRCMLESFPSLIQVIGGYSTFALLTKIDDYFSNEELKEAINSLLDYPLYNEDSLYELESQLEGKAWEDWAKFDLDVLLSINNFDANEETIKEIFYSLAYSGQYEFIFETNHSAWIDLKSMLSDIEIELEKKGII